MSKLPSFNSRLQMPRVNASLPLKRNATDSENDKECTSPKKKTRHSSSSSTGEMKPPASRGVVKRGVLQRSVSMANLSAGAQKGHGKSSLAQSKMRSSVVSLTGRASVGPSLATSNRTAGGTISRRPGANITNHLNSRAPANPRTNADGEAKGKSKRPGWDLKGRLMDMEAQLKTAEISRHEYLSKLKEYDQRIESLEHEKCNLNQNLEKTTNVSQANQEEVDRLHRELRNERDGRSSEKRNFENTIQSLEFQIATLERQKKTLEAELAARDEEIAGLKVTVSQLTSAQAGIEAQLSATKILLGDRNKQVSELETTSLNQRETIEDLNRKLQEAENIRRKLHNTVQELKGNIRVFCRVRPLIGDEIKNNGDSDVIHHINFLDERTLEVGKGDVNCSSMSGLKSRGNNAVEFSFDRVFNPCGTQSQVFEEIAQLVQSALDGYNVCIFAYGQTGSGKTFTMEGVHGDENMEGMIPRTVKHIFKAMKEMEDIGWSYKLEASFLEIYNETIRDLLASPKEAKTLNYDIKMQDSKTNEIYVTNLKIVPVENERKVHTLLNMAQQQRAVAATNMNEHSSRSHSVFCLKLTGENSKTTETCEGTLNLVDLAGSERLKESKSEGARLTETQNINRSLANLGNVIMAIGQKQSHIPYRNSKLTHLLQNCLGGNSKTLMFVNVSPLDACFNETLNSLRFATKVNQCHIGTATKQIKK